MRMYAFMEHGSPVCIRLLWDVLGAIFAPQSLHDFTESLSFMNILTVIQSAGTKVA